MSSIRPVNPSESGWFPNRLDLRVSIRERRRYAAVAFNGLFLLGVGFAGADVANVALLLVGLGLAVAGVVLALVQDPVGRVIRRETERSFREAGSAGGIAVSVIVRRAGVELGRDRGWVGRHEGVLLFEGTTTRFEIVRDDLAELPVVAPHARRARLRVRSECGEMEVEFVVGRMRNTLALGQTIHGWPDAQRTLPGPPTHPNRRTLDWYFRAHFDRFAKFDGYKWSTAYFALGGVFTALLLSGWLVYLLLSFFWFVYRDAADRARLRSLEAR